MLLPSCCDYFGLTFWTILILQIQARLSENSVSENAVEDNFGPDVSMIDIKFQTKGNCKEKLSNSSTRTDECEEEAQKLPNLSTILVPVTFKEITFSCDSHFPTSWKFHKPPFQDISIQSIEISKRRDVKNLTGFEHSRDSYLYRSNLTITFKHFLESKLWPISCRGSKSNGYGKWVTVIQGESDSADPLKLNITISKFDDSEMYDKVKQSRNGINKFCNVTLAVDTERKMFACGSKEKNVWSRPAIISCKTKDECVSIYSMDKSCNAGNATFSTECNPSINICQQFSHAQLPGVIRCSDAFENSIARSFFYPYDGKLVYEFWDDPDPQLDLQSLSTHPMDNPAILQFHYGQNVTFKCSASGSLFSFGFQWVLTTHEGDSSNRSEKIYLGNGEEYLISEDNMFNITKEINLKKDFGSSVTLTCFAPVWNRYTWIQKSIPFNLSHPVKPKIIRIRSKAYCELGHEMLHESLSAKKCTGEGANLPHSIDEPKIARSMFVCTASGKPAPHFNWIVWGSSGEKVYESVGQGRAGGNNIACESDVETVQGEESGDVVVVKSELYFYTEVIAKYTVVCNAVNFNGQDPTTFECDGTEHKAVYHVVIMGLGVALLMATCGGALGIVRMRRRARHAVLRMTEAEKKAFDYGDLYADGAFALPYNPKKFEISLDELEIDIDEVLGQGEFGIVVCGLYKGEKVAVKMLKPAADIIHFKSLMSEIKLMCFMDKHPHLVNIVGAYTKDKLRGHAYLVTEYCAGGNLLRHLQRVQKEDPSTLTSVQMITWGYECACAMEYLSVKKFIHKDLAARNILLTENLRAKVGDFGISKQLESFSPTEIYVQETRVPLPLKWMAIESLRNLEFSTKTDVWSFGVLLWEIFSLGESPYPGIPQFDYKTYQLLLEGLRMTKPKGCSDEMYTLMRDCWETDPKRRPAFSEIREFLLTRGLEVKVDAAIEPNIYVNSS